ncbi:hypothetical protein BGX27_003118 [Mortierella sp. AM989]|nr:hypothetical protein BGX27_003118 [Mortierella sp. AM989]
MVRHESPRCFWTGSELSTKTGSDARVRFSLDRGVFSNGRALSYGSEDQIIVAASLFCNCFFMDLDVDQRVQLLDRIEEQWEEGIEWADGVIEELKRYDAETEKKKRWTKEAEQRWKDFCHGRSLVTGQAITGGNAHIDRVFNSDAYSVNTCIFVEKGINFAKGRILEFQSSSGFVGESKIAYGVEILRKEVKELLDRTKPLRAR